MTQIRQQYRLTNLDVDQVNMILMQISNRLDQMEGYRGTPQFQADIDLKGNRATNAGAAVYDSDLITNGQTVDTVNTAVALAIAQLINDVWGVGSLFFNTVSTNPNTILGVGTWALLTHGELMVQEAPYAPYITMYIWQRTA